MHQVWPLRVPPADEPTRVEAAPAPGEGPVSDAEIVELYRMPDTGSLFVRTNFVSSLDGSVSGPDGRSGTINTPNDVQLFGWQRALSDLVLVGAGTVRAEGYRAVRLSDDQRAVREGAGLTGSPTLVVVSRSLKLDPAIADGAESGEVIVITGAAGNDESLIAAGVEIMRAPGPGGVDLRRALGWLADRGLRRVVCEGGPSLHRQLLADELVDEVCLTMVSQIVGGFGPRLVDGPPVSAAFTLVSMLVDEDGTLFGRWRRNTTDPGG